MDVIHVTTRQKAIEDGLLIDVSQMAREIGLRFPTAVTAEVWNRFVKVPKRVFGKNEEERLWGILFRLHFHLKANRPHGSETMFRLCVANDDSGDQLVPLKAVCGPGDVAEPVITIMLHEED